MYIIFVVTNMVEFDTERFITEIKCRPALWNFHLPEYFNKHSNIKRGKMCALSWSRLRLIHLARPLKLQEAHSTAVAFPGIFFGGDMSRPTEIYAPYT
jgi:hypothetical protein